MPATSVAQRRLFAIAEHHPGMLYKKNRNLLKMKKEELHKFASTSEKNLPERKAKSKKNIKKKMKSMNYKQFEKYARGR
jgi:hypothetical protein